MSELVRYQPFKEQGLASIEFALLSTVFLLALFVMVSISRAVYVYNAASQATRLGARVAVVCDKDSAAIKNQMIASVPGLTNNNITVVYAPAGCSVNDRNTVTVSITGFNVVLDTPSTYPISLVVPSFSTTLIRESMNSANNSICS